MNKPCEYCQYNGAYGSIVNPCEDCPNNYFMINGTFSHFVKQQIMSLIKLT